VTERVLSDLATYVNWLQANGARGYIGEVGWPSGQDADEWNEVAERWYDEADDHGLWVTAWAAGPWWPTDYPLAIYRLKGPGQPLVAESQAAVVAKHQRQPGALRGVNLPTGAFGAGPEGPSSYSAARPGTYGRDYQYDSASDLAQLARLGVSVVRVAITWERLQHQPEGPLDQAELERVRGLLQAARTVGLGVIVDLHGYGDYWIADGSEHRRLTLGSPALPDRQFVDLWRRLSLALADSTAVIGYGLMNEPGKLAVDPEQGARLWQTASQAAVEAIRGSGDHRTILVSGYGGASPGQWTRYHPKAWIQDPSNQVRYEAHQYFDSDRTGHYIRSFEEESDRARASGFMADCAGT
jgi:hypothetical protein